MGIRLKLVLATNPCRISPYGLLDLSLLAQSIGMENVTFIEDFLEERDMPELYRSADIYATLSTSEGYCFSIMEAQACGLPIVAHDIPPLKEIYGDSFVPVKSEGVLYLPIGPVPTASVKDAVSKLRKMALDEDLRKEYSKKSLKNAKRYDWNEYIGPRLEKTLIKILEP